MKKIICFISIVFFALSGMNAYSQTIEIETKSVIYEKTIKKCLAAQVDPEESALTKSWANYLKKNYKIKMKGFGLFSNSDVLTAKNVVIESISPDTINLFTNIEETPTGSEIKIFASTVNNVDMDNENYPNEFNSLRIMLKTFLNQFINEYYTEKISESSKTIKIYNKDKIKLIKTINSNKKKIVKYTNTISVTNVTIKENSDEAVKAVEKTSKLNTKRTKLENINSTSLVKIDLLDKKINDEKSKLEYYKLKKTYILQ